MKESRQPKMTRGPMPARICAVGTCAAVVLALSAASPANADFPYLGNGTPGNPATWKLPAGTTPNNISGDGQDWKFAATPDTSPQSEASGVDRNPQELCGIRGMSVVDSSATYPSIPSASPSCPAGGAAVNTAWQITLGRPDVLVSVLDSGIKWNDIGAMLTLRKKIWLNAGELPAPKDDMSTTFDPSTGVDCSAHQGAVGAGGDYNRNGAKRGAGGKIPYDILGQGAFNVMDYACDSRVAAVVDGPGARHALRHGPDQNWDGHNAPPMLTPEDVILAFANGRDHDHNGFASDIAGWNFVDNNNNPFDDVQYGHGTGEAEDSNGEANSPSGQSGSCPDCMVMPLRVGESFIADVNRFAQAAMYATDQGAYVIQEALGTLNNSYFARQAIEYAYHHGTVVIASAADEAAEHHNLPGVLPDTIRVNSVNQYGAETAAPPSYLQFNGCTNFGSWVTVAVESSSCSSNATGLGAGIAGLVYSAALNAIAKGKLSPAGDCRRVNGTACPLSANEVRQLMASGNIAGDLTPGQSSASTGKTSADQGQGQTDDVNFAQEPEPSCTSGPLPTCTDPNSNTLFSAQENGGLVGPAPDTHRYHARQGFDEFYGYGRLSAYKATAAVSNGAVPPQADITSPDWFAQVNPGTPQIAISGYVNARGHYTCQVQVAPGAQPNNGLTSDSTPGDFQNVTSTYCDGKTVHSTAHSGLLADIKTTDLEAAFPSDVQGFNGNENGGLAQTSNGRPNTQPYAFTVRVVVTQAAHSGQPAMTGEDRRQLYLHRDQDMLKGWPKQLRTDGASSPLLVDLNGDNRNELILATSDGRVTAYRSDGSQLKGWPVHTQQLPLHTGELAYRAVGTAHYCAVLGALAAGDLFHDGRIEVVADDLCGNVYAWNSQGHLVFHEHSNPAYSGAPLTPFHTVRIGPRDRTEGGFLSSPVLAHLTDKPSGPLQIIVAGEDRHLYAWQPEAGHLGGHALPGFPVLVEDPDKITAVDPTTNEPTFSDARAGANPDIDEDQGKIVDTPAVAYLDGPNKPPSIIVGSNEEYLVNHGDEGSINAGATSASLQAFGASGILKFANGRVYVIKSTGGTMSCSGGTCHSTAFRSGWPVKIGIIDAGLLPDVGEGINGSPVVAPLSCPSGGTGPKIGVTPDAGPAYILNPDGTSCYGNDQTGKYNTLETDFSQGSTQTDHPTFAAVGYPAFGSFDGSTIDFFTPEAGLLRALDVAVNEYQQGGQDFIGGWNPSSAQQLPGYPAQVNDLQFLTGPAVGQITAASGQEVIGGTASLDLAAFNSTGAPASSAWPKLTGDWTIATPTLGSFGTLDNFAKSRKDVVSITRMGTVAVYQTPAAACSPSSSRRFHHDNWSSGNYTTQAIDPGVPYNLQLAKGVLTFRAPGAALMCGEIKQYELVTSNRPITPQNFSHAKALGGAPKPVPSGHQQSMHVPAGALKYLAIRAVDGAGNVGLPAVLKVR
jgi:Subtilase family